jgi:hypothetical protein
MASILFPMGRKKSALEGIIGGLGFTAVAVVLYAFHFVGGWIVPLGIFLGVLPALSGARRWAREIEERRQQKLNALEGRRTQELERQDSWEKTILQIAKKRRGVVTPALVVLESDLKLDEAEKVLQNLAARGYAEMRVKDNGTIDYRFPDLE